MSRGPRGRLELLVHDGDGRITHVGRKGKPRPSYTYRYARRNRAHADGALPWHKPKPRGM